MWSIGFEERSRAEAALQRVNRVHQRVRGVVPANEPEFAAREYFALDQDLLLWVHATLVDSALVGYQTFVAPLSTQPSAVITRIRNGLPRSSKFVQRLFPRPACEFETYMHRMLAGGHNHGRYTGAETGPGHSLSATLAAQAGGAAVSTGD